MPADSGRNKFVRVLMWPLALLLPALLIFIGIRMSQIPSLGFTWAMMGTKIPTVQEVALAGPARQAGLPAGAVLLDIDGVEPEDVSLAMGETVSLRYWWDAATETIDLPVTPLLSALIWRFAGMALVGLACWLAGLILFIQRGQDLGVRLFFGLSQVAGLALVGGMSLSGGWLVSPFFPYLVSACSIFGAVIFFHFSLTYPVMVGRSPRWWIGLCYALSPALALFWDQQTLLIVSMVFMVAALTVWAGVYFRQATPDQRRRLRVMAAGLGLAVLGALLVLILPRVFPALRVFLLPWIAGLLAVIVLLAFMLSLSASTLSRIDRLLRVGLVMFLLGAIMGAVAAGLFGLVSPNFPNRLQYLLAAGLALLASVTAPFLYRGLFWLVDRLFYGPDHPDPDLIEKASQALAGCLSRRELNQALTRDIPAMLQISGARLWFGEAAFAPTMGSDQPHLAFNLMFQAKTRAIWTLFPYQNGRPFSSRDRQRIQMVADQAEVALRNVLLVETLRRRLDEIRAGQSLLAEAQHQLLRSRDNERSRLARDLHDGPIQSLVALNLSLGLLDLENPAESEKLKQELETLRGGVKALIGDLRRVCAELRPPQLDTLGLGPALKSLAADWAAETGIAAQVILDVSADVVACLSDEALLNLYRIVQEALHNIGKHARAQNVLINLTGTAEELALTVADDGTGFTVPETFRDLTQGGHFGLVGMRERVNLIGGTWSLESRAGEGTVVRVTLPLN